MSAKRLLELVENVDRTPVNTAATGMTLFKLKLPRASRSKARETKGSNAAAPSALAKPSMEALEASVVSCVRPRNEPSESADGVSVS